jgi:hypothetical protein
VVYVLSSSRLLKAGYRLLPYIYGGEAHEAEWVVASRNAKAMDLGGGYVEIIDTERVEIPLDKEHIMVVGWVGKRAEPAVAEQAGRAGIQVVGDFNWAKWWDFETGRARRGRNG